MIDIDDLEVLTEDGFKDFTGIKKTTKPKFCKIYFDDDTYLECSYEHKIRIKNNFMKACELSVGDAAGNKTIAQIEHIDEEIELYDLLNVEHTNSYITNGVTSHNCAFVDNFDEFFAGVFPTISSGESTKVILVSTVNGLNHFHKITSNARAGKNNYHLISVPWWEVPNRDAKWKQETLAAMNFDVDKFNQEFCVSGDTMITLKDTNTGKIFEVPIERGFDILNE